MTTLTEVQQAIATSTGTAFPLLAPVNQVAPYSVYSRVSNVPENTMADGASTSNVRIQVDIYAKTYAEAITLSESCASALTNGLGGIIVQSTDMYEDAIQLYRVSSDYSFWFEVSADPPTPGRFFSSRTGRYH